MVDGATPILAANADGFMSFTLRNSAKVIAAYLPRVKYIVNWQIAIWR